MSGKSSKNEEPDKSPAVKGGSRRPSFKEKFSDMFSESVSSRGFGNTSTAAAELKK
jgi:hypothetical protein